MRPALGRVRPAGVCLRGFLLTSMRLTSISSEPARELSPSRTTSVEDRAMRRAIRLARRGTGTTHPNPRVGAVLLKDGEPVGEGFHARPGGPHAEVRAIEAAAARARGATLVSTLEPCAHHGRTPPCVDAILGAGIRRVVLGMRDPNPLVNGRGIDALREARIDVVEPVREGDCRALNLPYLKYLASGLPWVLLKSMVSLDGRAATDGGDSRGLGGEAEQRLCHRLRAEHDAVLVGIGTVLADDPELTVRRAPGRNPVRVVLDSHLRLPFGSRLVRSSGSAPVWVATVSSDRATADALSARGVTVCRMEPDHAGRVPLSALLRGLAEAGLLSILVEGGPTVHTAFLREGLADRVAVGVAPLILGGAKSPTWTRDLGRPRLDEAIEIESLTTRRVGRDVWIEGSLRRSGGVDV